MTAQLFDDFLSPQCDRASFVQAYLRAQSVESVVLPVAGRRHIYVKFPLRQYDPQFRMKTCIAHYDRAPGTPGANDNSAAVAQLMDWAGRLVISPSFHNVRLLFTDGEEGRPGGGVKGQGAFDLAAIFRRLGITHEDVYVFDCTGRGTVPIMGQSGWLGTAFGRRRYTPSGHSTIGHSATRKTLHRRPSNSFTRTLTALESRVDTLLHSSTPHHLCLPLPYSDNAGFIAQGIAACCITMLPQDEADSYLAALMAEDGLEHFVLNRTAASSDEEAKYLPLLPKTWSLFHTAGDNAASLTAESTAVMERILDRLGHQISLTHS